MRNITLSFKRLFAAVLCLCGISAYAQDAITVGETSVPVVATVTATASDYAGVAYSDLRAEYDAATLVSALGVTDLSEAKLYIVNVTDGVANENTTDGWRNGAGDLCGWGDVTEESKGYCVKIYEADAVDDEGQPLFDHWGSIDYLGAHHLGVWEVGETFTALWGFVANDKAALVKVVVTFVEKPSAPQVEYISDINVVGSVIECSSDRESLQGTVADTITVNVGDLKTLLAVDKDELLTPDWFYLLPVADTYDTNSQVATGAVTALTNVDGWVHQVTDVETSQLTQECAASEDSNGNAFRLYGFAYDAETGDLTFYVAQKAGANLSENKLFTTIYLLYNDKAVAIKYTMNITVSEVKGPSDMTQVGSTDVVLEAYPATGYETVDGSFDVDAVAEALGCGTEDIIFKMLSGENAFYLGNCTEGDTSSPTSGGWFMDANGYPCSWRASESSAMWYITNPSTGSFSVGQDGGHYKSNVGDSYTTHLYATFGDKYYLINITLNIIEKYVGDWKQWKSVTTRSVLVQQLKGAAQYVWSDGFAVISYDEIEDLLGTRTPSLYGNATEAAMEAADGCPYTDTYTIDEKPGFWMDANAVNVGWGNGSVWGISAQASTTKLPDGTYGFACMWMGTAPEEEAYTGNLYLVNANNGKMITFKVTYKMVDEIVNTEEVGSMSLALEAADGKYKDFDLAPIAEALGCTVDELEEGNSLRALNGKTTAVQPSTGLDFDLTGKCVDSGAAFGFFFESGTVEMWFNEEVDSDFDISLQISFEYGSKTYTVNIRILSPELYTGIKTVEQAGQRSNAIFDLSGRRVEKAVKGVYIQNGKKVLK